MSKDAASLPDDVTLCHAIIGQQSATLTTQQRRIEQLEHYVQQLLRARYGPRSEKVDPAQLALFDVQALAAEAESASRDAHEDDSLAVVVREHRRRGGGRTKLPPICPASKSSTT